MITKRKASEIISKLINSSNLPDDQLNELREIIDTYIENTEMPTPHPPMQTPDNTPDEFALVYYDGWHCGMVEDFPDYPIYVRKDSVRLVPDGYVLYKCQREYNGKEYRLIGAQYGSPEDIRITLTDMCADVSFEFCKE